MKVLCQFGKNLKKENRFFNCYRWKTVKKQRKISYYIPHLHIHISTSFSLYICNVYIYIYIIYIYIYIKNWTWNLNEFFTVWLLWVCGCLWMQLNVNELVNKLWINCEWHSAQITQWVGFAHCLLYFGSWLIRS